MYSDILLDYFKDYGWTCKTINSEWVLSSLETDRCIYPIYAGLSKDWFTIVVNTNIHLPQEKISQLLLFELLRLNYQDELLKFCINEKEYLVLRIDHFYQEKLNYEIFEYSLNSICARVDSYSEKISDIK